MSKFEPSKNVYKDMRNFELDYWWYRGLREILSYFIDKFQPKIILDAGCGTGANINFLNKSNDKYQIYGVDISKEALDLAKEYKIQNIFQANVSKLPFENNFFDLIYCMDVLGNLNPEETHQTIAEFWRSLKKDGVLIIQTAALPWINSKHDRYWDIQKRYSVNEIAKIIEEDNFEILKKTYRHFFLFPIIAIIKLINKKGSEVNSGDFRKVPNFINNLLYLIMKFENYLLRFINFPIGSSVFIICRKTKIDKII